MSRVVQTGETELDGNPVDSILLSSKTEPNQKPIQSYVSACTFFLTGELAMVALPQDEERKTLQRQHRETENKKKREDEKRNTLIIERV